MKLKELINNSEFAELEITGITCDSRAVKAGNAFVCISGTLSDGHQYAASAVEKGAAVVIAERDTGLKNQIIVSDTHATYADMSAKWFGNPADSLKLIGVTGTNGKTSVTYMIKKILEANGNKVGLIGTIQNMIGDEVIETKNTTQNAYDLNALFAKMKEKGCSYAVMEVSSHALDQCRVYNLDFSVAVFTNLTQDHLDYHITMDNYFNAKSKLFKTLKEGNNAVINLDNKYAKRFIEVIDKDVNILTYGVKNNSDVQAKNIEFLQ